MAPEGKQKRKRKVKLSCFFTNEWNHEPWEIERIKRENTTKMNKVENNPLGKRSKEHHENLVGWKTWMEKSMNEKYMQALRLKRDVQGTIMINYDNAPVGKWKGYNMDLANWKHLDETPVKRGMIDTTLRLKQDKERNKSDIIWAALRL